MGLLWSDPFRFFQRAASSGLGQMDRVRIPIGHTPGGSTMYYEVTPRFPVLRPAVQGVGVFLFGNNLIQMAKYNPQLTPQELQIAIGVRTTETLVNVWATATAATAVGAISGPLAPVTAATAGVVVGAASSHFTREFGNDFLDMVGIHVNEQSG